MADQKSTALSDLVEQYLNDQLTIGRSRQTVGTYRSVLRRHLLAHIAALKDFNPTEVRGVLSRTLANGHSQSSLGTVYAVIAAFGSWLVAQGIIQTHPCDRVPRPKRAAPVHRYMTEAQVSAVYAASEVATPRYKLENMLIVRVLYESGMRVGELCGIRWEDIDHDARTITIERGKGGKSRRVTVSDETFELLREHADASRFPVPFRMTRKSVHRRVGKIGRRAGIPWRLSPHDFRRSMATNWYVAGGDALALQQLLGHAKLDMTAHYARSQLAAAAIERSRALDLGSRLAAPAPVAATTDDAIDAMLDDPAFLRRVVERLAARQAGY